MATWIAHLRLAENLLARIDGLTPSQFAIGNVGPDSGFPDEEWETFNPPGELTHFRNAPHESWRCADLEFYRTYLAHVDSNDDPDRFSYLLGYFFHLVTDNAWHNRVYLPVRSRFAERFDAEPGFLWEVKRDWYGLDFEYVRAYRESIFWRVFLAAECKREYLDFLPRRAIEHSLRYIKTFYQRTDDDVEKKLIRRTRLYLSEEEMDSFVDETTEDLDRIYRMMRAGDFDGVDVSSVGELPLCR